MVRWFEQGAPGAVFFSPFRRLALSSLAKRVRLE
jgi:hypothetical protein